MNTIRNITLILSLLFLFSCDDFLKENSQNLAYVETVKDLEEVLFGEAYISSKDQGFLPNELASAGYRLASQQRFYFPIIHVMDDDSEAYAYGYKNSNTASYPLETFMAAHTWQSNPLLDASYAEMKDEEWGLTYKRIAAVNSVIFQLKSMKENEEDQQLVNRVDGEAHFLRALYYFWLTNIYAYPYEKATANTALGIPLKTSEFVEDKFFERTPMQEIYDQIISDLKYAATCLDGIKHASKVRADKYAALALLSRVYLYCEEYEEAIKCADQVIAGDFQLLDYNQLAPGKSTTHLNSPETIFTQGVNCMSVLHGADNTAPSSKLACSFSASSDLLDSYDQTDLRLQRFFELRSLYNTGTYRCLKWRDPLDKVVSNNWLIRLPEVYLNKAEAEAILGRPTAAATIQILRAKRFAPSNLTAVTATGEELVQFIRDERRRELCYEAHRWFDLRRYAVNSKYPYNKTISHTSLGYNMIDVSVGTFYPQGTYELKPYKEDKAAYVLPIPRYVIEFNQGSLTNYERPVRLMIPNIIQ